MTLAEYKKEITAIFRRNTRGGFADWRLCGRLEDEIEDFLERSRRQLLKEGREKDLFEITGRAFLKWGNTDKDDSNGETQDFAYIVCDIWDSIYAREEADISHGKMFEWFMSKMDGSVIDYMEDTLLDYVMDHFKEPEFLEKKLDFLNTRIAELTREAEEDSWRGYSIDSYKERVLQIMSEQGRPIESIRDYAKDMERPSSRELLAEIELTYGNTSAAIAIYEELAAGETGKWWSRHNYSIRLKEIYKENGLQDKYEEQVERLLYLEVGSEDILEEYKALIPPGDWEKVRDQLFDSFKPADYRALPWYAQEECLDRLMDGVEACGYAYLKTYRKKLEGIYPDRCLAILVTTADEDVLKANKRQDYRHVARVLRWMCRYPGGVEKAAELAAKYRALYPRKSALIEELEEF